MLNTGSSVKKLTSEKVAVIQERENRGPELSFFGY